MPLFTDANYPDGWAPAPVVHAVEFIRSRFGSMRDAFLSDPGGYLDYVDADMSDEVAAASIAIIEEEWRTHG